MFCPSCKQEAETYETWKCPYCKVCWRAYSKRWRETHREEHLANGRKCWTKNKDKYNQIRKLGGASLYEKMFADQKGVCAICKRPETSTRYKTLSVDHCHSSGKIRGLLCSACNRALGLFQDNPTSLQNAISYLKGSKND